MKKMLFVFIVLCFASSLTFAEDAAVPVAATDTQTAAAATTDAAAVATAPGIATNVAESVPEVLTLKGDVIDNMCADANKDRLAEFVKTHTKECAIMPGCIESGYSIFADGKLYKFDKGSGAKVAEFLKAADSKLEVTITAKQVGDELSLVSIENQN